MAKKRKEWVRVCGRFHVVTFPSRVLVETRGKRKACKGCYDPNTGAIRISTAFPRPVQVATLLHEIDHAIEDDHPKVTRPHDKTDCRAVCLAWTLEASPWLRQFLQSVL